MDEKYKKSRLDKIRDEVGEFHPLLHSFLSKLPNVTRVDYTHGQFEYGADFVLTRLDATLGDTEYVGLLVKVGDLNQNSLWNEVERQLSEMSVPRYALEGKRQIRIGEAWVVTTGKISRNAQELIAEKFSDKNVKFISGDRLISLIDTYADHFWYDVDSRVGNYLSGLAQKIDILDRNHDLMNAGSDPVYIEQDLLESRRNSYSRKSAERRRPQRVDIHKLVETEPFVFIEGGMGIGKSKLLRQMVKHYANVEVYQSTGLIPVLSSVRELFQDKDGDVEELLYDHLGSEWRTIRGESRLLLLFDGFDELPGAGEEQIDRLTQLEHVTGQIGNSTVVVASRFLPTTVDDEWDDGVSRRVRLSPLSLEKTLRFLELLCRKLNVATGLVEDLRRSQLFQELPRTPIAAILLARLINENSVDLPANLTELYSKYLELMLGRWDAEKGLESQKEFQTAERVLMDVSTYVIDNNLGYLTRADFTGFFQAYLKERNLDVDPEDLSNRVLERSQILSRDPTTDTILFTHRTFAEYYYAKSKFLLSEMPVDSRAFQMYWANIFFFYLGLRKDCPRLLHNLTQLPPSDEPEFWIKLINLPNYMLAANATPYDTVKAAIPRLILEAAHTYYDIVSGQRETLFGFMPEIALLWWTQTIIRDSFGYSYFEPALEDAALAISDSEEHDTVKIYALFFLSAIAVQLELDSPFRFLLEEYHKSLPASLEFALYYEDRNAKELDRLLRKQMKRVKKRVNSLGKDLVERLHRVPLLQRDDLSDGL